MDNENNLCPSIKDESKDRKNSKEKLTVRFENSVDNDTDLTEVEVDESSAKPKYKSDYFANEEFFKDDYIKLAEDIIGEKENWKNQDIQALRQMLSNCKTFF